MKRVNDFDGRLESAAERNSRRDDNLDTSAHLTPDDFCEFGRASRKCRCDFCREQVAREHDEDGIV